MLKFVKLLIYKIPSFIDSIVVYYYRNSCYNFNNIKNNNNNKDMIKHVNFTEFSQVTTDNNALKENNLVKNLIDKFGELFSFHIELVTTKKKFIPLFCFLKMHTNTKFEILIDIVPVDLNLYKNRFKIIYHLLSIKHNQRLNIVLKVDQFEMVESLTGLYNSSNWLEREAWDMFGIYFSNHPDLRRILTDYGFQGFPLRKNFPLSGYCELKYDDEIKSVYYDSLELSQEFRLYDFRSAWSSATSIE